MGIDALVVILLCTLVQNVFGVGILVFGTPLLLVLGYDYLQSVGLLLPSSLAVSLLQVLKNRRCKTPGSNVLFQSALGVLCGVFLLSFLTVPVIVYLLTSFAMFMAAALRLSKTFQRRVAGAILSSNSNFYFLNGAFHGFSNLGGILLVLRNNLAASHQSQALYNTAVVYGLYVVCQVMAHSLAGESRYFVDGVYLAPFVLLISHVFGRQAFERLSLRCKDNILGLFFVCVGSVLIYKVVAQT